MSAGAALQPPFSVLLGGFPAAVWRWDPSVALFSILVLLLFWPVRQRSCVQNQSASKDCSGKQCFSFKAKMKNEVKFVILA